MVCYKERRSEPNTNFSKQSALCCQGTLISITLIAVIPVNDENSLRSGNSGQKGRTTDMFLTYLTLKSVLLEHFSGPENILELLIIN
jgi:hypothetical protein